MSRGRCHFRAQGDPLNFYSNDEFEEFFLCGPQCLHKGKMKKVRVDLDFDVQPSVYSPVIDVNYELEELCDSISKDLIDLGNFKISLWP